MFGEKTEIPQDSNGTNDKAKKEEPPYVPKSGTPRLQTNYPGTALHEEAHRHRREAVKFDESLAEATRAEILERYGVSPEKALSLPASLGLKREMRAFTVLENKKDPDKKYYVDGHTAHAILLKNLLQEFRDDIKVDPLDLPDDFFDFWVIKKGFIDPRQNGFREFTDTHDALVKLLAANKESNGLNEEELTSLIKNPASPLPNWFVSGDTGKSHS